MFLPWELVSSASLSPSLTSLACPHSGCKQVDLKLPPGPRLPVLLLVGGTSSHLQIRLVFPLSLFSLPYSPTSVFWDHFPGKPPAHKPWSQVLLLGEPRLKHGVFGAPKVSSCTTKGMNPTVPLHHLLAVKPGVGQ